jgi:ribonucleotide reductase alpha subunit
MFFEVDSDLEALKDKGEAPDWMRARGYQTLVGNSENGYLLKGETPKGMYSRLAKAASQYLKRGDLEEPFFNMLWKGWLGPASPILANFGTARGLPISCFSTLTDDDMESIIDNAAELAYLTSVGGGVATHLSGIRAAGSPIKSGGLSDGILLPLRMLNASIPAISQNGLRRGQMAAYLDIEHPDAKTFLRMRRPEVDERHRFMNTHNGVILKDSFFDRCKARDPEALELWSMLLTARIETGEPYIVFDTAAQRDNPKSYAENNLKVNGSNLCCLEGSTRVVTSKGHFQIKDILDEKVKVWDGQDWVEVLFEYKGKAINLVKVDYADGTWIRTTLNHRFPLVDGSIKTADQLKAGDEVLAANLSEFMGSVDYPPGRNFIEKITIIEVDCELVYCCTIPTTGVFALSDGRMTGNSEIFLATSKDYSFVCCLSSLNVAKYDEWKNTNTVELAVYFLDAVMEEFIQKSEGQKHLKHTREFAIKSRAIGLGVLGYHTYLQAHDMPFDSYEASIFNKSVFRKITYEADAASYKLGQEYGIPEWCHDLVTEENPCISLRHSHRIALAPTRSNSAICASVSRSIEPLEANAGFDDGAKGAIPYGNYELKQVLAKYGYDTDLVWGSISANRGSVKHLKFLTAHEREVFKTAREIDQEVLIKQASERAYKGWQGQSLNLFYNPGVDPKLVHKHHMLAYTLGLKSLYYLKSNNKQKAASLDTFNLDEVEEGDADYDVPCPVCEG